MVNLLRRDAIFGPSQGRTEWSLHEWRCFRREMADWIQHMPSKLLKKSTGRACGVRAILLQPPSSVYRTVRESGQTVNELLT